MDPHLLELLEEGRPNDEVSAIVRLVTPGDHPAGVRVVADLGRFVTVRIPRRDIPRVRRDPRVASMKAPDPVIQERDPLHAGGAAARGIHDARRPAGLGVTGAGVVVGVVDWGLDVACPSFRSRDGRTRLVAFWDQRGRLAPDANPYGYGAIHRAPAIDRALASGDPYAALRYHPGDSDPGRSGSHGTHVLDIAAGNGGHGGPVGIAPEAHLAFVHLGGGPASRLENLGDSVNLIEAVHFLFESAGTRPCVVNLSIGNHGGPHDGTTLVEQALDELLTSAPGRALCQSTGNYRERQTHSALRLLPGQRSTLTWQTDRADRTPNELEVWYPGSDRLRVVVEAPTGERTGELALGQRGALTIEGSRCCRVYHRDTDPQNRDHLVNVFLDAEAPPGVWRVTLIAEDVTDGRVHAWIERDEACPSCQSRFASNPRPHGTTGTISNGRRSIAVGAYDAHEPARPLASFSSMGPTRDGRQKPDVVAPGVEVLAARSMPREGSAALLTRKSGTSMAAPHVTGTVALVFEAAPRALDVAETRNLVLASAAAPSATAALAGFGSGYLDTAAAVTAARRIPPRIDTTTSPPDREENTMTAPHEDLSVQPYEDYVEEERRRYAATEYAAPAYDAWEASRVVVDAAPLPSPAAIFDGLSAEGTYSPYAHLYEVVVPPGGEMAQPVESGDMLIVRALGEGGLAQVSPLAPSEVFPGVGRMPLDRMVVRPRPAPVLGEAAEATMTRTEFERRMLRDYAVTIRTGTFDDQEKGVNSRTGVTQAGRLTKAAWRQWDPGPSSDVYEWILDAFDEFETRFGGVPPVSRITFFATHYHVRNGIVVADPSAGASYGGGEMEIFQAATTGGRPLPIARSNASGTYPNPPVVVVTGVPGQTPGAPLAYEPNRKHFIRSITHELGHGLAEQAGRTCRDFFDRYGVASGWHLGRLYDVGIPAVATALRTGAAPPATVKVPSGAGTVTQSTEITGGDWNHPRWVEQPMTHYMATAGVGEDFAEAVMSIIDNPRLFASRCPSRHAFLTSQGAVNCWKASLRRKPPVGDFPTPPKDRRWA